MLGVSGTFDDADVVALLAERRETADFIGTKLWRFFAVPEPTPRMVERTSDVYFASGGSIREVVRTILLSEEMYSADAYRTRVKSPVEVVFGAERALGIESDGRLEMQQMRVMGQQLFLPPDPAGWTGGDAWINSTTMLARSNFANLVTQRGGRMATDVGSLLTAAGATRSAAEVVDWVLDLLVGGDVDATTRETLVDHLGGSFHFDFERAARDGSLNGLFYLALSMPLYQVS